MPVVVVSFLAIFLLRDVMEGHALVRLVVAKRAEASDVRLDPNRLPVSPGQYPAVVTGKTATGKSVECTIQSLALDEVPACGAAREPETAATEGPAHIQTFAALSEAVAAKAPVIVLAAFGLTPDGPKVPAVADVAAMAATSKDKDAELTEDQKDAKNQADTTGSKSQADTKSPRGDAKDQKSATTSRSKTKDQKSATTSRSNSKSARTVNPTTTFDHFTNNLPRAPFNAPFTTKFTGSNRLPANLFTVSRAGTSTNRDSDARARHDREARADREAKARRDREAKARHERDAKARSHR